ncbi:type VII secretion protein EccCa [Compostimonas suwonensis]|uniref:S-DNA-T family DNA segregation ATPase FtsK/SpoIIIE n=1 Tax=Compostimonas suwonensis TaxID=1048394 RepID=A0A2M9C5C1_9MICO|nr:type VII secretion protein EccCa [Compostimonas suwonensis]PJJ65699.1 S-DNA-T family DNA segregation ATPase FtsK/SpoIIIE [Compostimonas suwonensis]
MSVRIVHRPARVTTPLRRGEAEEIAAPPQMAEGPVGGMPIQTMLPVLGAVSSVTMILVLRANPVMVVVGAMVLVVALVGGVGMAFTQRGNAARTRRTQRERYLDFLEKTRAAMRERSREVRETAQLLDPSPQSLLEIVRDPARLWERRRGDADFLRVRLGHGDVPWFELQLPAESNPVQPFDPIMFEEAGSVARHYSLVQGMPVTLDLDRAGTVSIVGGRDDVLAAARALVLQLASLHSPDDVHIAAAFPEHHSADWAGLSLLPHAIMGELNDGPVPARRVASSVAGLARVLGGELGDRAQEAAAAKRSAGATRGSVSRLVVFVDDYGRTASTLPVPDAELSLTELGVTIVHLVSDRLHEPSDVTVRVTARDGLATVEDTRRPATVGGRIDAVTLDRVTPALVDGVARALAPLRLGLSSRDEAEAVQAVGITELLGITDLSSLAGRTSWAPRSPRDFLRVPIGLDDYGAPVLLDLKESAQLGMGPHGICIGATGSGKSEMLRTLILGLALSHPPDDLSMVLVDYKGGAAFAPFRGLPHVAGIIDNLADDPQLTERARTSIAGEVVRRQQQLKDADSSPSITHYRELRTQRPELPPMPHLFVVIDEFGELLTAEPDFVDLLLTIGRIGRSIGVHLLLSSQRIETGRLRGLDTYLSYRLGLRTFSEAESAVVLDTPDAFHLPAIPGYGFLKVDTSVYRRFRAGYVSGPIPGDMVERFDDDERPQALLLPTYNGIGHEEQAGGSEEELSRPALGRALIDECVDRLRGSSRATTPVWLPPLPSRLTLSEVITEKAREHGSATDAATLRVPIGLLDDPRAQRQDPWLLDLNVAGGHVALMGAPQSGRSTFLRTVAASIALTHTPRHVTMYGMDLTGGGLARIEGFPHVGGVATRSNRGRLQRLLEELHAMLATREAIFAEHAIDSLQTLRATHAAGRIPQLISADVVLLVDGFATLRSDFEELEEPIADLLRRGGSFGIHVVMTMNRWNDLRMNLQSLVGTRLELRINDPADSVISRKLASTLRADQPGRVLTDQSLLAQISLPVLDQTDDAGIGDALDALAARTAASWQGPAAAPIRLLPDDLSPEELPDALDEPVRVPFGLRQDTMEPAFLELGSRDQHLIAWGDTQSGKTTLLRGLLQGLVDRHTPDELVIALMDIRGELVADIPDDYLGGHASSSREARSLAAAIAEELEKRQGAGANKDAGPRIVVVADDYDVLASGGTEPLKPLLPYLPSARDLRLHVLITRPVAGASRGMYDVAMQTVRDTGGSALVMSGERSEGQLLPQLYAEQMVAGRGRFVRRGDRPRLVQVARFTPDAEA